MDVSSRSHGSGDSADPGGRRDPRQESLDPSDGRSIERRGWRKPSKQR